MTQSKELVRRRIFLESLARCGRGAFVDRFYERFLASSPEVRAKFASTDFGRQRLMLLRSLELSAAAADGDPDGVEELRVRAETHSRSQLNVEPHLYDLWLESAISSASEADPLWAPDVETAWRSILGAAIHHLRSRYES
ncbi:MAG: globin [Acidobacteria bacterium]|nr:globin [Acidobacteriota bacterium]